ncbi:MAG: MarR family winged helix-turn-helix transcriptional regulator [Gaiella sp.]
MQESRTRPLSAHELAAWRGFLRAHAGLVRELDHELETTHGLPLHEYEVLLLLAEADHGRLRMSELADGALLSQSGLTRLVDRLEQAGLVVRERCEQDRRGLYARITDEGSRRFAQARVTHLAGVRSRFLDRFTTDELDALAAAWERVQPGSAGVA